MTREDDALAMFESDVLLPAQRPERTVAARVPGAILYLFLLEDVVGILQRWGTTTQPEPLTELVNAIAWMEDPEGAVSIEAATTPVTFAEACARLQLEPEAIRRDLHRRFRAEWSGRSRRRKPWSFLRVVRASLQVAA